jgi:Flp pilus assembly protein TadG
VLVMTVIRATDRELGLAEPHWRGDECGKTWLPGRRLGWLDGLTRDWAGATAVEFALAAPLLLGLLMPLADLGLAFSRQIQVQQAAQAGAQFASLHPWNSSSIASITSAVTSATQLSALTAAPAPYQICGCPDGGKITAATCNSLCANGESAGYYVIVNAQLAYSPILPYSLLGNSVNLTAQATVRGK